MQITVTDLFYNNEAIAKAYKQAQAPLGFLTIWSSIAKLMLQSGSPTLKTNKINGVSKQVEGEFKGSPSFTAMQDAGMINSETNDLSATHFEEWWKAYPYRIVSGKKVKAGRKDAIKRFNSQIKTVDTFAKLMEATSNYSSVCNKLPKDPVRFLKDDFWREFITIASDNSYRKENHVSTEVSTTDIDALLNGN